MAACITLTLRRDASNSHQYIGSFASFVFMNGFATATHIFQNGDLTYFKKIILLRAPDSTSLESSRCHEMSLVPPPKCLQQAA